MQPDDLESRVDRALRGLPAPRAPRTLLPRVMAAVAMAERPWHARGWRTWPPAWQLASAAVGVVLMAAVWRLWPPLMDLLTTPVSDANPAGREVFTVLSRVEEFRRGVGILWRVIVTPLATVALAPLAVLCAATIACAMALGRLMSLQHEASR